MAEPRPQSEGPKPEGPESEDLDPEGLGPEDLDSEDLDPESLALLAACTAAFRAVDRAGAGAIPAQVRGQGD
jgi:hypothetical protein